MTSDERDELMRFLRDLSTSREPVDPGARELIAQAIAQNPSVGYRLVQQVMGLRMALQSYQSAPGATPASPQRTAPVEPNSWGSGLLKTALAAGLGAAAGTVLASQADSWLDAASSSLDLGD
jgi:hypothetical protein